MLKSGFDATQALRHFLMRWHLSLNEILSGMSFQGNDNTIVNSLRDLAFSNDT
jgi:hypothetical protein